MAFSWFFRGFFVALFCLEKQCLGLFRGFFVVFSWLFRGFFVAFSFWAKFTRAHPGTVFWVSEERIGIPPAICRSAFLGNPRKCSGECFRSAFLGTPRKCPARECLENWECLRECPSSFFPKEKRSWEHSLGHSQFSGRSREHSPGQSLWVPKKHSESTRRSTFGDSPESTPANGRQDRKERELRVLRQTWWVLRKNRCSRLNPDNPNPLNWGSGGGQKAL